MQHRHRPLAYVCLVAWALQLNAGAKAPVPLPRSTPEAQGIASTAIAAFIDAADSIDAMHSFMLVRHGQVVAEGWWAPYTPESRHSLYSLSKSFTSTAVGLAVAEGRLSVDDTVVSFFPEAVPGDAGDLLKAMRVSDLLRMSTGQHSEARLSPLETNWVKTFLAQPVVHKPGSFFLYNTPATYMLSAIVQKRTGLTVLDYLRPRLFEPLGIEGPDWGTSPDGVTLGGYGLSIRTEDIARFGQLLLQRGMWRGQRLVPAAWIEAATSRQAANGSSPNSDWDQGYGYQFWRCRHNAFRGDGAFGQYCIVMPDQDAVVAITSGVRDMQAVMNLVWQHLLPAMQPRRLRANQAAHRELKNRLAGLMVRPQSGAAASPRAASISGRRFVFPANDLQLDSLRLEAGSGSDVALVLRLAGAEQRVACGHGAWRNGRIILPDQGEQPMAATGAWTAEDTFSAKICLYETPFYVTVKLRFEGDLVVQDAEYNVGFGSTRRPQLIGQSE